MGDGSGDGEPGSRLFEGHLSIEELSRVRRQLTSWARTAGLDRDTTDAVILSGYEALANTVEHAYRERGRGPVEVRALRIDQTVTLTVTDHGRWRTPSERSGTRGHGLTLIRKLGNHLRITATPNGTTVRMTWQLAN
jgi:serine/threonine-protein kinase RsbW